MSFIVSNREWLFFICTSFFQLLVIYFTLNFLVWWACAYFIFKKAYKTPYHAFIPLLNLYDYMNICHIGWFWAFIPGVNIIVFWMTPYLLGYQFSQKEYFKILSLLFPFIMFIKIAFFKVSYIHPRIDELNIKSVSDIDKLEKDILRKSNLETEDLIIKQTRASSICNKDVTEKDKFLTKLDHEYLDFEEEILDDNVENMPIHKKEVEVINDAFFELDDYEFSENLEEIKDIEKIEKSSLLSSSNVVIDNTDYSELEDKEKSTEEIAFQQKRKQQLVCPKCNSSLIGAKDICPGCGLNLREL